MDHDDLIGTTLAGKYLIEDRLGSGGMGTVYRARHIELGYAVAVKVLLAELSADWKQLERLKREAKAAASLSHPNVAQVTDLHIVDGQLAFIVMELVEGRSLMEVLASEGPLSVERTAALMQQVLGALGAAHDAGIVHRDVKPANIMVVDLPGGDEQVKLLDFGIAKLLDGAAATKLTGTGIVLGTPLYMSPEQALGRPLDHHFDLYAVGVILFEALSGTMPFEFTGLLDFVGQLTTEPPRSLGEVARSLPQGVVAVVDQAIALSSNDRYGSAREMADAIESWENPTSASMQPLEGSDNEKVLVQWRSPPAQRRVSRAPIVFGAICVGVLVGILGIIVGIVIARGRPSSPPQVVSSPVVPPPQVSQPQISQPQISPPPLPLPTQGAIDPMASNPAVGKVPSQPVREASPPPQYSILNKGPYPPILESLRPDAPTKSTLATIPKRRNIIRGLSIPRPDRLAFSTSGCEGRSCEIIDCVLVGRSGLNVNSKTKLVVRNSWIEGTQWGVQVNESAQLTLIDCVVIGPVGASEKGAIWVMNNATLEVRNTKIKGIVYKSKSATVEGVPLYGRP